MSDESNIILFPGWLPGTHQPEGWGYYHAGRRYELFWAFLNSLSEKDRARSRRWTHRRFANPVTYRQVGGAA